MHYKILVANVNEMRRRWLARQKERNAKAYLITPTNSLTFQKTEECYAVKHNFTSFAGNIYHIIDTNNQK